MTPDFSNMTVTELRQFAKDNQITLGSVSSKAAIIQKLQSAVENNPGQAKFDQDDDFGVLDTAAQEPRRAATIIMDDNDDIPATGGFSPRQTSSEKPRESSSKTKPVFSLQGSRAWHNPQPFSQQQNASKFSQASPGSPFGKSSPFLSESNAASPYRASRFGPEAGKTQADAYSPLPDPQNRAYRPLRPSQSPFSTESAHSGPAYHSGAQRPVYGEYKPADFLPQEALARQDFGASREPGLNPAVPEMLATGDCGDGEGILEIQADGYGFLRAKNLLHSRSDVYVSGTQIRRFRLRNGDYVVGKTRPQRENDRYSAMLYITSINGEEADEGLKNPLETSETKVVRKEFDNMTPQYPNRQIYLSNKDNRDPSMRFIDLFCPIGFGQRALVLSSIADSRILTEKIALSIKNSYPEVSVMVLSINDRPEEVTELKEKLNGDLYYACFDDQAETQTRMAELGMERAMRMAESGKDVVVIANSFTAIAVAYHILTPTSARSLPNGLAAGAMNKPKRFFGAARNLKEGGSLSLIAITTQDDVNPLSSAVYNELKQSANMVFEPYSFEGEKGKVLLPEITKSYTLKSNLFQIEKELGFVKKIKDMVQKSNLEDSCRLILSMMETAKDNDFMATHFDEWMSMMGQNT